MNRITQYRYTILLTKMYPLMKTLSHVHALACLTMLLLAACAASKPNKPISQSTSTQDRGNNVVNVRSQNSRHSSAKSDGTSTIIFKGKNNIINIEITDSDIAAYNTKTITIVEGDNNNVTSSTRRCVLMYKNRTDTLVIKGNQLKIDFTADNVAALVEGAAGKREIGQGEALDHFQWVDWKGATGRLAAEETFIEALDKKVPLAEAYRYYEQQARAGNYQAFFMLGRFFDNLTFDIEPDISKAMRYYEMAARHNHAEAALRLAHIYDVGDFEFEKIAVDRAKARYYYSLAAQNGSDAAKEKLALWGK